MTEQRLQPAAPRNDVGVEEGDEIGGAHRQAGVARGGGPLAAGMAQHLHVAVRALEVSFLDGVDRPVVHHHDSHAAQCRNQSMNSRQVVAHRYNDGHITMRRSACGARMGDGGVEQCACDLRAERVVYLEPSRR